MSAPSVPTSYRVVRLALLGCPVVGKEPHLLVMMLRCLVAVSTGGHRWLLVTSDGDEACLRKQRRLSRTKGTRRVRSEEEHGRYLHWWDDTFPDASRQLYTPYGMSIVQALLGWPLRMNDMHEIEKAIHFWGCIMRHGRMLAALQSLYEGSTVRINNTGRLDTSHFSKTGLKQGCPLSPTLFGLFINGLHRYLKARCPEEDVHVNGVDKVSILGYADDFCVAG